MDELKKEVDKIELAIKNINKEVQSNHQNEYLVLIGEHIIDCITSEEAAEKVLVKGKSMQGCLSHIQTELAKVKAEVDKKTKMSGSSVVAVFKVHFEAVQMEMDKMKECISQAEEAGQNDEAAKLRMALKALCSKVLDDLGEDENK